MWMILVSVIVLVLDWLALDDITTGHEPDFYLEYAMLAVSAVWFAAVAWRRLRTGSPRPRTGT